MHGWLAGWMNGQVCSDAAAQKKGLTEQTKDSRCRSTALELPSIPGWELQFGSGHIPLLAPVLRGSWTRTCWVAPAWCLLTHSFINPISTQSAHYFSSAEELGSSPNAQPSHMGTLLCPCTLHTGSVGSSVLGKAVCKALFPLCPPSSSSPGLGI